MKFILPAILLAFMLNSCTTVKPVGDENGTSTEVKEIEKPVVELSYFIIGEGGGFTGLYTQYKVWNSGKVELYNEEKDSFSEKGDLPSAVAKEIFEEVANLGLVEYEFYKPGNLNYRIKIPNAAQENLIVWSDNQSPSEDVLIFYKKVMNAIGSLE